MRPQNAGLVDPLLGSRRCHGNQFVPHSLGVLLMLASENEVDVTTTMESWHILPAYTICPCDLDLWPIFIEIGAHDREVILNICACYEVYRNLWFWNIQPDFVAPLLGSRRCHGTICAPRVGCRFHVSPDYEVDTPIHYWVIAIFIWIRYVTLWPWPLTSWPGVTSRDATWVVNTCAKFDIRLTVSELWRLQFSMHRQLKVLIFTFFAAKGVKYQISSF